LDDNCRASSACARDANTEGGRVIFDEGVGGNGNQLEGTTGIAIAESFTAVVVSPDVCQCAGVSSRTSLGGERAKAKK